MTTPGEAPAPRVVVLADDLIWATRLAGLLRAAGAVPVPARDATSFEAALAGVHLAIVDLTARAYDGVAAVAAARAAGAEVACLAQHDDASLRRAARTAGAGLVLPYRKVAEGGAAVLAAWLALPGATG